MANFKKIMVPIDFSENSPKVLQSAIDVAEKFEAALSIVFVVQSFEDYSGFFVPHMPISQFEDEMIASAEQKMESFLAENFKSDLPYNSAVIKGDVAEEIVDYAAQNDIAMIVMGTHGYKGLEKVLFGSVAEKVVKTSPCPVLTVNPYK
ncbi:MAG: universal stress protein [Desulfurivibrionaceae bacterium]|nr:universal stress protein [Desulfobulbales bacterium]MDT8334471.1 universal stress protein [Desulfurivibrionaceae bacterium]